MNEKKKCHFFLLVIRSHYTLEHMSFSIATSSISSGTATTSRLQCDCTALMYDSMTTDELKEALRDAHREINDAQRIISELKLELATAKVKKGGQKVGASEELLSADQEIAKLAQIYMLFHQPWVRADDFRNPKPSFESNSAERFSSDDNLKLGATMELYDCVPERLHDYMQSHSDFATKFMKELSSSRSSIIDRLRKNAATIFGLTPDIFLRKFNRSTNSTINTLLGYNASGKTVALLIIYRPSAIFGDALPILRSNSPYASRSESGTTAGLICCVATLARFIMSTDTELTGAGVGNVTGIGYFADFDAYKKILTLSRESSSAIIQLYRIWDARLFPNVHPASESGEEFEDDTNGNGNDDEEISQFLRQLHVQESPSHLWRLFCTFNPRTQLSERARNFRPARNFWMLNSVVWSSISHATSPKQSSTSSRSLSSSLNTASSHNNLLYQILCIETKCVIRKLRRAVKFSIQKLRAGRKLPSSAPNTIASQPSGNRIHPAPVAPPPVSSPSITSILNTGATAFDSQGTDSENLEAVQGPGDNLTEPVKPLPRRAANRRQVAAAAPSSINSTEPVIPIAAEQPQKCTTRGKKGTTKRR
ncbi:uncharacterized protein LACBIDRAFT_332186 [Laccaria bicolor S238N-H82]|uniref:Predicted protein n=1 Tax=Laccaria bicolor (strain S238N-H82 / ATCC MYA-4686) TaxID=486041 RepID=B0DRV6_LACBS|nr:uncharacterized protein LACBIDRAFT_332186 [Laccaria bicolor S238N-H82]EDR02594.1 predicted protein [Laccaria bicolor S238N-H82]|eukprot:XP_001886638.1 predicted protein [Laccaria bicolor S238N-H82]